MSNNCDNKGSKSFDDFYSIIDDNPKYYKIEIYDDPLADTIDSDISDDERDALYDELDMNKVVWHKLPRFTDYLDLIKEKEVIFIRLFRQEVELRVSNYIECKDLNQFILKLTADDLYIPPNDDYINFHDIIVLFDLNKKELDFLNINDDLLKRHYMLKDILYHLFVSIF